MPTTQGVPGLAPMPYRRGHLVDGDQATILLVEDNAGVRNVLVNILGEANWPVRAYEDADACIADLENISGPAVLVTDCAMPGLSGRALADIFHCARPNLPVIFITGLCADMVPQVQPNETLVFKPFVSGELLTSIERAIAQPSRALLPLTGIGVDAASVTGSHRE